jgi:serine/threonine protein kinase
MEGKGCADSPSKRNDLVRQADFSDGIAADWLSVVPIDDLIGVTSSRADRGRVTSTTPRHASRILKQAKRSVNLGPNELSSDPIDDTAKPSLKLVAWGSAEPSEVAGEGSVDDTTSAPPAPSGGLVGIWRLGRLWYRGDDSLIWLAQPADAPGNTRWEYLVRTVSKTAPRRDVAIDRLARFVDAAASASDPHLISVVDANTDGAEPFLVTARLAGETLRQRLSGVASLGQVANRPLAAPLWWTRQAALAAAALHRGGYAHGDIRAENLFLSPRGDVTLIDLGSALPLASTPTASARSEVTTREDDDAEDVAALGRLLLETLAWIAPAESQAASIEPIAEVIAQTLDPLPSARPTAATLAQRLAELEFGTLERVIRPDHPARIEPLANESPRRRAA